MISLDMIVYALVGLALLFLIIKLLKWPLKILINGILGTSSSSLSFLGTSIIITVGVVHETMTILNSMTMNEKYIEKSEKEGLFRA